MDLLKDSMEYLTGLGGDLAGCEIVDLYDRHYMYHRGNLVLVAEPSPIRPKSLSVFSLKGLVDFIKNDADKFREDHEQLIVQVESHGMVSLQTPVYGSDKCRDILAYCEAKVPVINFDRFMNAEEFSIMAMTKFEQDENRDTVLALAGSIVSEESMQTADDGFSQRISVKRGIASNGSVKVVNPVILRPRRTFVEVEQPNSPFIIRFAEGNNVALFEADGGAWRIKAVENIAAWLSNELGGMDSIKIIA